MPGINRPTKTIGLAALLYFLSVAPPVFAQRTTAHQNKTVVAWSKTIPYFSQDKDFNLFGTGTKFIENIGQYGQTVRGYEHMGKVLYGYEGLNLPVLFTPKGMVHLQRKMKKFDREDWDEMEANNELNQEIDPGKFYIDRQVTIEWINANPDPVVVASDAVDNYYVYRTVTGKAKGYKKITYRNLYNGIDLVCSFKDAGKPGFEYSFVVHPGANAHAIRFRIGGDIKETIGQFNGDLHFASDIDTIIHSAPIAFYQDNGQRIISGFTTMDEDGNHGIGFPLKYDKSRTIVIDPFVTATSSLTGPVAGKAKDIDFDYAGNVYVVGGGSTSTTMLAKFDKDGNLLWTFNGSLTSPNWQFGIAYGGWVVEKTSGKTYIGQGGASRSRVIRLTAQGAYDNYITDSDPLMEENWKMLWNCDGGTPKMFIAAGTT